MSKISVWNVLYPTFPSIFSTHLPDMSVKIFLEIILGINIVLVRAIVYVAHDVHI